MKKYLYIALAAAALTGCSSDEAIEMVEKKAIAFDNVFVNNATRATDLNKDNMEDFSVYGSVTANNTQGMIFTNTKVYKLEGQLNSNTIISSIGLPAQSMNSLLSHLSRKVKVLHGHTLLQTQTLRMVLSHSIMKQLKQTKICCLLTTVLI